LYPGIGNGHLKQSFDIIASLLSIYDTLKLSIMSQYSDTAEDFIELFYLCNVSVFNGNDISSKVALLDTMHKPGDVDTIESDIANWYMIRKFSTLGF